MSEKLLGLRRSLEKAYTDEQVLAEQIKDNKMTAEQRSTFERTNTEIKDIKALIEMEERRVEAAGIEAQKRQAEKEIEDGKKDLDNPEKRAAMESKLFNMFVRGQSMEHLKAHEREYIARMKKLANERASTGTTDDNHAGFLTFESFSNRVIDSLKHTSGLIGLVDFLTTSHGNPIHYSDVTEDEMSEPIEESDDAPETQLSSGRVTINAYKFTSKVFRIANELLADSAVDVEALVNTKIVRRHSKAMNHYGSKGSGAIVAQPMGMFTDLNGYQEQAFLAANTPTYDELVLLMNSLNAAYKEGGNIKWSYSQDMEAQLRLIKDANDRPMWNMGDFKSSQPTTLFGFPTVINNSANRTGGMAPLITTTQGISFGDHKLAYQLRAVTNIGIRKSEHVFFKSDETGFVSFIRFDGKAMDTKAIVLGF